MVVSVPDILARIVAEKQHVLGTIEAELPALESRAEQRLAERRDFRAALLAQPPAVIAEIKKASPSKGLLCADFRPEELAKSYAEGGAACLSVLTDEPFFQGSLADLETARAAVAIPVLRKDFTIHPAQIVQAAAHGADAILLIAAILSVREMRDFREAAARYRLAALVEVHDAEELARAMDSGAEILGVNNRDLRTFRVDLATSLRLAELMPAQAVRVSESGIETAEQVQELRAAGYAAFLVGEHLVRSGSPAAALRTLRGSS